METKSGTSATGEKEHSEGMDPQAQANLGKGTQENKRRSPKIHDGTDRDPEEWMKEELP